MHKENKPNDFIQQFLLLHVCLCCTFMRVTRCMRMMLLMQEPAFSRRTQMCCALFTIRGMHTHASWYSHERVSKTNMEEKKLLNKDVIFVFFAHEKNTHSFIQLWLNPWLFYQYPFYRFGPWTCQLHCCLCRVRKLSDFIQNIFICVLKMNKGLTGLKKQEGEQFITSFSFLCELSL